MDLELMTGDEDGETKAEHINAKSERIHSSWFE